MDNPSAPLPAGLLLDLDDTILTYDAIGDASWRHTCLQFAARCGVQAEALHQALHDARRWYWSDPERHRLGRLRLDDARAEVTLLGLKIVGLEDVDLAHEISGTYARIRDAAIDFFPGAREALEAFVARGVKLALMTNGQSVHQRAKLARFDLEGFFEVICIEGEMGFGKPDQRVFQRALEGLGLEPEEVWAVGDNLAWDVGGPQQMGIYSVWNDFRRKGLPEQSPIIPDRTIHALSDLLA